MPTLQTDTNIDKSTESYVRGLIAGQILRSVEGILGSTFQITDHTEDSDDEMTTIVISVPGNDAVRDVEILIAPVGVITTDDDDKSTPKPAEKKAAAGRNEVEQRIFLQMFRGYDLCRWCGDPIYNDGPDGDPHWVSGKNEEAACPGSPNTKHDPSGDKVGE